MKYFIQLIIFLSLFTLFISCSSNQKAREFLQTNSATTISRDYQAIKELLLKYKKKLDLRNPKLYDKNLSYKISYEIKNDETSLNLLRNSSYKSYLEKAFEQGTKYRNDFLILGIYKMVYETYNINNGHQLTSLSYNSQQFKNLFYTLKVLRWEIRTKRDKNGNFIFVTWQKNWQIELNKKLQQNQKLSMHTLNNLPSIKDKKENIMEHSNFNFEIILTAMIDKVKDSLKAMGEEPLNLSINAMKAIIFL